MSSTRRKLAMAQRALDFAHANPSTDSGYVAVVARLEIAVARGDVLAEQETGGRVGEHSAVKQRRMLRASMQVDLKHLVKVGESAARTHRELAGKFLLPRAGAPHKAFITAANVLLSLAQANKDVLIALGLGDQFLDDLSAAITSFDGATDEAHSGRWDHVGAKSELATIVAECSDCVGLLDGLVMRLFPAGSDAVGAWQSARNVAGPFRHAKEVPAPPIAA
ncbi:MAG TPA: hypothetical protein VGM77_05955 [Gemmatimonadales bacterium]